MSKADFDQPSDRGDARGQPLAPAVFVYAVEQRLGKIDDDPAAFRSFVPHVQIMRTGYQPVNVPNVSKGPLVPMVRL